ncbi:MAG: hypothetical protein ACOX4H_03225 [Bacillota bacterium]
MTDLEEAILGLQQVKKNINAMETGERKAKFFLALLFCMALFLWTGFQLAFIFPLGGNRSPAGSRG